MAKEGVVVISNLEFEKLPNVHDNVSVYLLEDQMQQILAEFCRCSFTKVSSDQDPIVQ